jgi:lipoyl(octanoyl) transferase
MSANFPEVIIRRHSKDSPWTYVLLDRAQREVARRVREGGAGALFLSEVAPVITLGRRTPKNDLLAQPGEYASRGIEILETDRGGLATYHGPGQWVVFVVDHLEKLTGDSRGVRKAVCALLESAQAVAARFGVQAEIREGTQLGLWTKRGKLSALGIQIEERVLLHGLAFNVRRTPESFWGLNPCGLKSPVTFLEEELSDAHAPDRFDEVARAFREEASARFWNGSSLNR